MLMVMTVRIAAVIMHAPGKLQQKKGKHINAEIIKILSDSLFIFWGEYTSAGKQPTCSGKTDVATTPTHPRPVKHGRRPLRERRAGNRDPVSGLCPAVPAWPRGLPASSALRRRTACYCPGTRRVSGWERILSLKIWQRCWEAAVYKARSLCELKAWNNLISKLRVLKENPHRHSYLPSQPGLRIRLGIK